MGRSHTWELNRGGGMIEKEEEEGLEWKAGGGREEGTKGY